jgi:hypothetical protein
MKRTSWILGSIAAFLVAACEGGARDDAGAAGGAGEETGTPGMTADTVPAGGAMDTALGDTARMDTGADTAPDTAPTP